MNRLSLELTLGIDECNCATATAQDEFRLVLEQHLDDLVAATKHDSFTCPLPLLDVGERELRLRPSRCILFREGEFKRLELLIAVKIALKVLEKHDLLVDGFRELEEIKVLDLFVRLATTHTINVVKVEQVRVRDDLR